MHFLFILAKTKAVNEKNETSIRRKNKLSQMEASFKGFGEFHWNYCITELDENFCGIFSILKILKIIYTSKCKPSF